MKKILILFAHPAFHKSKINAALRGAVENIKGVTFHDLYANYPDMQIDVQREQELCVQHDVIIFHHPFYWYSAPSIIKEWEDLVLEYNWAYGSHGKALHGKLFFQTITAGGPEDAYRDGGYNRFTIKELTTPFQATAHLCGLRWLPPYAILGVHRGLDEEEINDHVKEYQRLIVAVRDERVDLEGAKKCERLNGNLTEILSES